MGLFDCIAENKKLPEKELLTIIKLSLKENSTSTYSLGVDKHLKEYANPYLWRHAQADIVYSLLREYKICIVIYDAHFTDIYNDYIKSPECKKLRIIKDDGSVSIDGDILFAYLPRMNMDIIIDMIEGTSLWDYNGIVKIYGYSDEVPEEFYKEIIRGNHNDDFFALKVEPTGDCEGLDVMINNKILSSNSLKCTVKEVLEKYSLDINNELM